MNVKRIEQTSADNSSQQVKSINRKSTNQDDHNAQHKSIKKIPFGPDLDALSIGQKVSVVIPAIKEAENLPLVLPAIPAFVHEIILVDGDSGDDSIAVAREIRPDIVIIQQHPCGKGSALRAGFSAATGDIVVAMDADGSTDPAELPLFIGALLAGADYAKGSRFLQGGGTADMPGYRMLGNWGFTMLVRLLFGGSYSDLCYGFNAFWKRALPKLNLDCNGFEIETVMNVRALRAGLKVAEVPSFEAERVYGSSHLQTIPDGWRVLKAIFREWWRPGQLQEAAPIDPTPVLLKPNDLPERVTVSTENGRTEPAGRIPFTAN